MGSPAPPGECQTQHGRARGSWAVLRARRPHSRGLGADGILGTGGAAPSGFSPGPGKGLKGSLRDRGTRG